MTAVRCRVLFVLMFASAVAAAQPDSTTCSAATVREGESFVVKGLPSDHTGWVLGILRNGTKLFLISYDDTVARRYHSKLPAPLPAHDFGKLTEVRIDTKTAVGVPMDLLSDHIDGPASKIFSSSGEYQVYLTAELGGHEASPVFGCTVKYEASRAEARSVFAPIVPGKIVCPSKPVHAEDSFSVNGLPNSHIGFTFAITHGGALFLISYNDLVARKFKVESSAPLDTHEFAKMTKISVDTKTAVGVPLAMADGHVEGPARKIFTSSGEYQIYLHPFLGHNDFEVIGCNIHYEAPVPQTRDRPAGGPRP